MPVQAPERYRRPEEDEYEEDDDEDDVDDEDYDEDNEDNEEDDDDDDDSNIEEDTITSEELDELLQDAAEYGYNYRCS